MIEIWYTPPDGQPRWFTSRSRTSEAVGELEHYERFKDQWPGTFELRGEENECGKCDGYEMVMFWSKPANRTVCVPCSACIKAGRIKSPSASQ